ncbi:MAG: 16S rRNA (guanine(527)-N(7))-methyltransferase RsmG [Clostridia bacterium]|nr:16S rRNA (guanine(527)-N(7))-methyltransferase RsmG [Clostridia bacterium]
MADFTSKLIMVAEQNEVTKGIIAEASAQKLEALTSHMLKVNEHLNLTAIRDEDGVILKHLVDSSACVPYIPFGAKVADVGCGGGFPSLVIAILREDVSVFGVDSVAKKVKYVDETAHLLGLDNVSVSSRRAEELGQDKKYREAFDIVTARAVARLNILCELCVPLLKVGGKFIAMKSLTTEEELEEAKNAILQVGAEVKSVDRYTLKNDTEILDRTIIVIEKVKQTPSKYPRNNSQIAKKPL